MFCLIGAESAIFTIFVVAHLFYAGKSLSGPMPADVLRLPVFATVCLLSSSLTIHAGVKALKNGSVRGFARWWLVTLVLGSVFLAATAIEWRHLISNDGLTIHTNLFGTTYFSLVGLHAFHVTAGVAGLTLASTLALLGYVTPLHASRSDVFSLYWHFVDGVWIVVFLVVYVLGR
jgi:cytochrome c oxidase subunit 3/cytochrome o ubiquinol oxidase subunit 3